MCISASAAELSGTILFAGRRLHRVHGWVEVLGYQNTAANQAAGPNAMLLHLPARKVTSAQFLNVGRCDKVLRDMASAVQAVGAGRSLSDEVDWMGGGRVEVFERDIYTIVLADRATDIHIPRALERVPERKRPVVSHDLLTFYADCFPSYPVALCCFDNAEAMQAKPLMLWYRPLDEERLVLPAIDCHTGAAPDLAASVRTDHTVVHRPDPADLQVSLFGSFGYLGVVSRLAQDEEPVVHDLHGFRDGAAEPFADRFDRQDVSPGLDVFVDAGAQICRRSIGGGEEFQASSHQRDGIGDADVGRLDGHVGLSVVVDRKSVV